MDVQIKLYRSKQTLVIISADDSLDYREDILRANFRVKLTLTQVLRWRTPNCLTKETSGMP